MVANEYWDLPVPSATPESPAGPPIHSGNENVGAHDRPHSPGCLSPPLSSHCSTSTHGPLLHRGQGPGRCPSVMSWLGTKLCFVLRTPSITTTKLFSTALLQESLQGKHSQVAHAASWASHWLTRRSIPWGRLTDHSHCLSGIWRTFSSTK